MSRAVHVACLGLGEHGAAVLPRALRPLSLGSGSVSLQENPPPLSEGGGGWAGGPGGGRGSGSRWNKGEKGGGGGHGPGEPSDPPFKAWGEDLEGGACSHNLYTFGPTPRRIRCSSGSMFHAAPFLGSPHSQGMEDVDTFQSRLTYLGGPGGQNRTGALKGRQ